MFAIFPFSSNEWNLMKLILRIYGHGVIMHTKFCQNILSNRGVMMLMTFHEDVIECREVFAV